LLNYTNDCLINAEWIEMLVKRTDLFLD